MDSYRHKGLRKKLIENLRDKGIFNERILEAMLKVPRHLYLDKAFEDWAYKDQAFQIDCDQTISQPYTVAYQTHLLDPNPNDKILEIGTGSGYQASVLSFLCKKLYTIERHKQLFNKTSLLLESIGFQKIRTLYGDGYQGAPRFAQFSKILVTAGASYIPKTLIEQLKIGGYLVIPIGDKAEKTMIRITKTSETEYDQESFGIFKFVPFAEGVVG